jgi:hypothetical protein
MAYQDIKRAKIAIHLRTKDPDLNYFVQEYQQLAQEVVLCHNRIFNISTTVAGGVTNVSFTLPAKMPDANYAVALDFGFNNGGGWVDNKTTTTFRANWVTATVGSQTLRAGIIG